MTRKPKDGTAITFGFFDKGQALRLLHLLAEHGIEGQAGFDPDFARLHRAAVSPPRSFRRARAVGASASGYFVTIGDQNAPDVDAAVVGTEFAFLLEPEPEAPDFGDESEVESEAEVEPDPPRSGVKTVLIVIVLLIMIFLRLRRF